MMRQGAESTKRDCHRHAIWQRFGRERQKQK